MSTTQYLSKRSLLTSGSRDVYMGLPRVAIYKRPSMSVEERIEVFYMYLKRLRDSKGKPLGLSFDKYCEVMYDEAKSLYNDK